MKLNIKLGFGVIVLFLINFLVFNIALKKEVDLVDFPVVKETIYPRVKIEKDMITYIQVPSIFINDDMYADEDDFINKYSDILTTLPKGSPFYKELLFDEKDLPDFPRILLNDNQVVYTLNTDLVKLSGNSIVVGQQVDLYTTYTERNEKPIVDLFVSAVRVIGVKDKNGIDIGNPDSNQSPKIILLALDSEIIKTVRAVDEIASLEIFANANKNTEEESILNQEAKILSIIDEEV